MGNEMSHSGVLFSYFNRDSAMAEGLVYIALGCLIFPANVLAIYRFYKQKMSKTFFILASSLCINNFLMGFLGLLMGIAKYSPKHPLEFTGCCLIAGGIGAITTCTLFVQALISYERRRAIVATNFVQKNVKFFELLALAFILPFGFWSIYMALLGGAAVFDVRLHPNTTETILMCNPADVPFIGGNEVIFTIQGFIIPTVIIVYNYWPIWKLALKKDKKSNRCSSTNLVIVRKKRQIRLAIIMSFTVLEFFIFYMPQFGIVMATVFSRVTGSLTIDNEVTTIGWGLWFFDATFNPLWTTFLQSKTHQTIKESNSGTSCKKSSNSLTLSNIRLTSSGLLDC